MFSSVASSIAPERIPKNLHFLRTFYANESFTADVGQFTTIHVGTTGAFAVTGGQGVVTNASGGAKDIYVTTGTAPSTNTFAQITVAARTGSPSANDALGIGIVKDSSNLILFEYDRIAGTLRFSVRLGGSTTIKASLSGVSTISPSYKIAISIYKNRLTGYIDSGNAEGWDQMITTDITSLIDLTATDLSSWRCGFGVADSGSATATTSFDNFIAQRRINYFDLQPPALVVVNEPFTTNTGQFTQFGSAPGTFSFTGGKGQVVHGPSDNETFEVTGSEVALPQFFASVDIVSFTGLGRASVGLVADGTHFILARYSTLDGNLSFRVRDGAGANVTLGAITVTYTLPFKLGLSLVGNSIVAWVDIGNGWERATGADVESSVDLKTKVIAGAGYKAAIACTSGGNFTAQYDNLKLGRFGGIAIRDETFVTNEDGTPYMSGALAYFTGSASDTQEQTPHGGTYCATFSLDLTTFALTQLGCIMVNRSGKIQNDHASHLIHYTSDSRLFISSWGDSLTAAPTILHKLETGVDLLNGTHVVSSMATIAISLSNNGYYDPCMVKIGSTYYLAYTKSPVGPVSFHACIDSSTNLTSWTNVMEDSANTPFEGTKIFKADARFWVIAGGAASARIYGPLPSGAFDSTLDADLVSANTFPHPPIVPYLNNQYLITFDDTRYIPAKSFTWGHVQLHRAPRYK